VPALTCPLTAEQSLGIGLDIDLGEPAMNAPAMPPSEWRPDPLLSVVDVAIWLGKPKATLYAWHSRKKGPRAIRVGNTLRYRRSDVERWLDAHTDAPTDQDR
jgi:predicted DNA-binding transcriptional regulator AlpA